MRTLTFKKSVAATFPVETAFEMKVQEQKASVVDVYVSGSTGVCTVTLQKVFTDEDGTPTYADIVTMSPTAGTLLTQVFDYKVDHMRIRVACGTAEAGQYIRIKATSSK